jgi:GMP synthase-like glutamine amidotransferase
VQALVLQHQEDAPAALFECWARQRDVTLTVVRADLVEEIPDPGSFDFALALGSDESAGDLAVPWVAHELRWLREADHRELPVLGICFGAQALATALGGGVRRAQHPEIGWVSIDTDSPEFVAAGPWFTWHEDLIELPERAVEIARNDVGVQAFTIASHLGVQFHPEVTRAVVRSWATAAAGARQLADRALDGKFLALDSRLDRSTAQAGAFRLFDAFVARLPKSDLI